ncbi:hypothetical protein BD626DRAFT_279318 [Schizophyllum amplum]|uniref:Uncharacterized protein n=1 Tax=Schizophyllum amplum TaxID=97359 RepID=A0A550BTF5_9AGAR|nr:hypothetical protein BD626DRAFT_279318 [Auriculariopsis ampla]
MPASPVVERRSDARRAVHFSSLTLGSASQCSVQISAEATSLPLSMQRARWRMLQRDLGQGTFSALHGLDIAYHLSRPPSFCARRHLRTKTHVWLYAHIRNALAEFSHPMVALFSSPTCALRTARRYASIVTSDDDDIVATGQDWLLHTSSRHCESESI